MTQIELRGVQKWFGSFQVIKDLNLVIEDNEFIVLLGQSGCGKTTTLRAIAGLETIDEGDILIDGKPVQHLTPADRDIAMVFQSFSLYPHMTVYENIAFPLRATGMNRGELDSQVQAVAKVLRIGDLLERRPSALSGGDMQRVAIGRALVRQPKAMLMDEPIGALDAKLREEMRAEIKRLHLKQGSTTIYVTHDQIEAMSLADRIVIMHEGVLQQVGTPNEVYSHPQNLFVAQFVGSPVMNIANATVKRSGGRRQRHGRGGAARASPSRRTARQAQRQRRQEAVARHPPGGRAGRARGGRRLRAGRGPYHRAARLLRHRRPAVRRADAACPHPLGLRHQGRQPGLCPHRPGAGALLRHGERTVPGSASLMAHIELKNVSKKFGNQTALRNLDLEIADGEFFVLLGETGAGKTTTLRLVAGLEKPTEGQVFIDGIDVADWGAAERDVALVLQQYSLYPRYTVRQNLEFPLKSKLRRVADAEIAERVARVAKTLRIEHLLERKTDRLSGGEMQRVSIGRAIVRNPRVFLMDEPLSALDAKLRETLRTELKNIQMNLGQTFLFVTHDQIEAMSMGDKIGVLNNGRLVQSGTPYEIYNNPKNTFVARSVGSPPMNLLDGKLVSGRAVMTEKTFELPYAGRQWRRHRRPRADLRHSPRRRPGRSRRTGRGHGPRHRKPRRRKDRHAAHRQHQPARHRAGPDRRRHRQTSPLRMGPQQGRAVRQGNRKQPAARRVGGQRSCHLWQNRGFRPDGDQWHLSGREAGREAGLQSRRKTIRRRPISSSARSSGRAAARS